MKELTFSDLDDVAFAMSLGRFDPQRMQRHTVTDLGPVLELRRLALNTPVLKSSMSWLDTSSVRPLLAFLKAGAGRRATDARMGVFRLKQDDPTEDFEWTSFGLAAQQAAKSAGFLGRVPAQFVGAMGELYQNIFEHAGPVSDAFIAFQASPKRFEFVVSDDGIGILASLRSAARFAQLQDHAGALSLALQEGVSQFDKPGRGLGFRSLFVGLANLNGTLRFRSGDAALTIDGSPVLVNARPSQKPEIAGFFTAVVCEA